MASSGLEMMCSPTYKVRVKDTDHIHQERDLDEKVIPKAEMATHWLAMAVEAQNTSSETAPTKAKAKEVEAHPQPLGAHFLVLPSMAPQVPVAVNN